MTAFGEFLPFDVQVQSMSAMRALADIGI